MARRKLNLDYAAVKVPFTGQADLTDVNVGDLANADQTQLLSLAQRDPIQVQMALSPSDVTAVRAAMAAGREPEVQILDRSGEPSGRTAHIEQFDNTYNPRTSRLRVRAGLANPDGTLAPGQFLRVRLRVGTEKKLLVPTTALSAELHQQVVYAVKDGAVHPQPVEPGEAHGDDTAVLDGLAPGMRIVPDDLRRLHASTKVVAADRAGGDGPAPGQISRWMDGRRPSTRRPRIPRRAIQLRRPREDRCRLRPRPLAVACVTVHRTHGAHIHLGQASILRN